MRDDCLYCPQVKTEIPKKDCIEIRCPFHRFWNGLDIPTGANCQWALVKKEAGSVANQD